MLESHEDTASLKHVSTLGGHFLVGGWVDRQTRTKQCACVAQAEVSMSPMNTVLQLEHCIN